MRKSRMYPLQGALMAKEHSSILTAAHRPQSGTALFRISANPSRSCGRCEEREIDVCLIKQIAKGISFIFICLRNYRTCLVLLNQHQ